jgi:monoamine oxidase
MRSPDTQVIIIGAGAAGLAAADELARADCAALLLEARDRLGGRIWSARDASLSVPIELGAEFIHGEAPATLSVLRKASLAAVDAGGEHWTLRDGVLAPSEDLLSNIQQAIRNTSALKEKDMSFDAFLDRHLSRIVSPEACAYARMFAQGFDAADTSRASARSIVEEWTAGGSVNAGQYRPLGGYGPALEHLAAKLRGSSVNMQLNTAIQRVRWSRHAVEVGGVFLGRTFKATAKAAIVTLPLGVLQASPREEGRVRFTPALAAKRAALRRLAPGPVLKVLLKFREAFWEKLAGGRYRHVSFFHPREAAFPTFWTALPLHIPLMVAWAAGPNADRLRNATEAEIVEHALASLAELFGQRPRIEKLLESAWVHDWQRDPYARGAYSYVRVGGDEARRQLAEPIRQTLFFAGEATDTEGEAGTVAGALQSGTRAAREVIATLRRKS